MLLQVVAGLKQRKEADILLLPYWEEKKRPSAAFSKEEVKEPMLSLLEKDFQGKSQELLFSYVSGLEEKRVLLRTWI